MSGPLLFYPCPDAHVCSAPTFHQENVDAPRKEGDVTIGHLLAAIHTYDGDIMAEAKREEEEFEAEVQRVVTGKAPSLWRRVSESIPRLEIYWG